MVSSRPIRETCQHFTRTRLRCRGYRRCRVLAPVLTALTTASLLAAAGSLGTALRPHCRKTPRAYLFRSNPWHAAPVAAATAARKCCTALKRVCGTLACPQLVKISMSLSVSPQRSGKIPCGYLRGYEPAALPCSCLSASFQPVDYIHACSFCIGHALWQSSALAHGHGFVPPLTCTHSCCPPCIHQGWGACAETLRNARRLACRPIPCMLEGLTLTRRKRGCNDAGACASYTGRV